MIKIENICKNYIVDNKQVEVLKNISLDISEGEFLILMGESGCGKSTFLNCVGGLLKFDSGKIIINNKAYKSNQIKKQIKEFGFIFQDNYMIDNLSIIENVSMPLFQTNRNAFNVALEILNKLDIQHIKDKYPAHVSGGERQRASIARSLMNKPSVLFADEPTASLNKAKANEIMELFTKMNEDGQTIIMTTHSSDIAAYGSRVVTIKDGIIDEDIQLTNDFCNNLKVIESL